MRFKRIAAVSATVVVGALIAVAIASASNPPPQPDSQSPRTIAVSASLDDCGSGWTEGTAGVDTFVVTNNSTDAMEVYLQSATSGAVYAELEGLGSGASANMPVVLGAGSYEFVCLAGDAPSVQGHAVSVGGSTDHALTPGILPVTRNDLYEPTQQYSAWISSRLPLLVQDAEALVDSVNSGDRAAAERDWVTAHDEYEQLGAAYGAFGDADAAINGLPAAGLTASTDPNFTGFHRIESILWGASTTTSDAAPFAATLLSDITELQTAFQKARLDPLALGIRAHEILENAVQVQLNNAADQGSGTTFATLDANLAGTRQAVDPLRPILSTRGFDLNTLDDSLNRASTLVDSYRRPDGSWMPLTQLTTAQRQAVNARFDETVELLAPIAAICDIRRSADS